MTEGQALVDGARYSRQMLLPGFGLDAQLRLQRARVLVIGMGGLGSPAALYLAAAGIGHLGLADFDRVEISNLNRQILHGSDSLGVPKVESAAARLRALNPAIELTLHPAGIDDANIAAVFSAYDLVIDGCDDLPARYRHHDAAWLGGVPLVYGSIFQFEGQLAFFERGSGGPCYRCLFPELPDPASVPRCAEAGVLGALCGMVGALQAQQAINWLTGVGTPLRGRLLRIDARTLRVTEVRIKPDPECPLCGRSPSITGLRPELYRWQAPPCSPASSTMSQLPIEIPVESIAGQVHTADGHAYVLDVREPFEHAICHIPGSVNIPMGELSLKLDVLPRDRPLYVLCHHGGRSMRVTQFLRAKGFDNCQNLGGGIDRYAVMCDPAMARY
jgi:sulfur-carrier protein adenylyltransferase/sulfurtransferase